MQPGVAWARPRRRAISLNVRAILALLWTLPTALAAAQDHPPQGIAFAQTEEGAWLCRHEDPFEALACAREHCLEQAPGQDCAATAWCYPAQWAALMTVWLPDVHTTKPLCGVASEKALIDVLSALCAANEFAERCDLALMVDPEGMERPVDGTSFPGGAAGPRDAGTGAPDGAGAPVEARAEPATAGGIAGGGNDRRPASPEGDQ